MKDPKFPRSSRSWGWSSMHSSRGLSNRGPCKIISISMFALLMLVVLLGPGTLPDLSPAPDTDELVEIRAYEKSASNSAGIPSHRNTSFFFGPRVTNLDALRKSWWKVNPSARAGRPKVLLVTGSQPNPCPRPIDTHMYLKTAKNKIHYSRMHDLQMYYNFVEPDKEFVGSWAKLPVLRMLMVAHPEVEWFWWMNSDTVVTDMMFELPLQKYRGHNFVVYGDDNLVYKRKDWKGLMTGNFLIRNCQWSLHLLDAWGSMGPAHSRQQVGKLLSDSLPGRPQGMETDEQSALVYLLSTEKKLWAPKVYLDQDLVFTGVWVDVTDKLEEIGKYEHGDSRWPIVTQFSGCSRCDGSAGAWPWEQCQREMQRALDFADNQVYRRYGYQLLELGVPEVVPITGHKVEAVMVASPDPHAEFRGFPIHKLPGPAVENWDAQRQAWFKSNPGVKSTNDRGKPKTMIVTSSSTGECAHPVGGHSLLQATKNKVDYARFHDMQVFYGMVEFDRELEYWWTKIPTIRVLMLAHPDVEWFWWCDGDALITDMVFEIPYEKFEGQHLVLYGDYDLVYEKHDWIGINAGVYLVRNCQWSLDLFDVWASLGAKANRPQAGVRASEVLPGRIPDLPADDQSSLLYMLITDKEKQWSPQVRLERSITMSGYWKILTPFFEHMKLTSHPGLGNMEWPWITHFAGCQPCGTKIGNFDVDECRLQLQRAFYFADDQVLGLYGLEHVSLASSEVRALNASAL